jgi:hypothetical protein
LTEWVAGRSYAAIHTLLRDRDVRVGRDRATVEDVVSLCENGFGYDIAMMIASLADLAEPLDPAVQSELALLQRQVKSGHTDRSALAFLEWGFADGWWRRRLRLPGLGYENERVSAQSAATTRPKSMQFSLYFRCISLLWPLNCELRLVMFWLIRQLCMCLVNIIGLSWTQLSAGNSPRS